MILRHLLLGACTAALIALPATLDPVGLELAGKAVAARGKGGDGGGRSGGGGQGHGRGDRDSAGRGADPPGAAAGGRQKDAGSDRPQDTRFAEAQERYRGALGHRRAAERGFRARERSATAVATLDPDQTAALIGLGWERPRTGSFRNHGQRVSTMVALAKELGYPASVGAMQANFGTPFENGVMSITLDLQAARASAQAAPADTSLQAEVARLEAALAEAITGMPTSSFADWSTVDLDVTNDGVVDAADLAAARSGSGASAETGTNAP